MTHRYKLSAHILLDVVKGLHKQMLLRAEGHAFHGCLMTYGTKD